MSPGSAVLCIDAGNTRVKWSVQPDWKAGFDSTAAVSSIASADLDIQQANWQSLALVLEPALLTTGLSAVLLCNVLGAGFEALVCKLCKHFSLPLHVLAVRSDQAMVSSYINPHSLGKDRWAGCLAVSQASDCPVNLLVSFGTATTVDGLIKNPSWKHLGGYIVPGVQTMLSSLHLNTAELPRVNAGMPENAGFPAWPTDTQQAISWGVANMQADFIQACACRLTQQFGQNPAVWLSGGFAANVRPLLPNARLLEHAVFRGLLIDYQQCSAGSSP
jgi:type III pantothenate kinase